MAVPARSARSAECRASRSSRRTTSGSSRSGRGVSGPASFDARGHRRPAERRVGAGLQAAIAACHASASSVPETDWERVVLLYEALGRVAPSPVVELNRPSPSRWRTDHSRRCPSWTSWSPPTACRGRTCSRACAVSCSPGSAGPPRHGRAGARRPAVPQRPRAVGTAAQGGCAGVIPTPRPAPPPLSGEAAERSGDNWCTMLNLCTYPATSPLEPWCASPSSEETTSMPRISRCPSALTWPSHVTSTRPTRHEPGDKSQRTL
jgi:hypothetical protein